VEHGSQSWEPCPDAAGKAAPGAAPLTFTSDLDGRKKILTVGGKQFRLAAKDNLLVVTFGRDGEPAVTQVQDDLTAAPVSKELMAVLRARFPSKARRD
jgi:hypothetical protein